MSNMQHPFEQGSSATPSKPDNSLLRLELLLRSGYFGSIRLDDFTLNVVIEKAGSRKVLTDVEITRVMLECQNLGFGKISRQSLSDVIHLVAEDNAFDSAQDWLFRLPAWDGESRLDRFLPDYLGTKDTPYEWAIGRYLWTGMAGRVLSPGCQADMVPVLVGRQGLGKSSALRAICPFDSYYGEARLTERPSQLARRVLGKVLVEWEEMRGIAGKCDADEVKTFITSPYVETVSRRTEQMDRHKRRFIIAGTANQKEILRDTSGNRRYLPFEVDCPIEVLLLPLVRDQFWAEARDTVLRRMAQNLSPVDYEDAERLAMDQHSAFFREARWAGEKRLLSWLASAPARFSTEEALDAINVFPGLITQREKRDMAGTLRQLGYERISTRVPGMNNPQQRWHKV